MRFLGFLVFGLVLTVKTEAQNFEGLRHLLQKHSSEISFSLRDLMGKELFEVSGKNTKLPASIAKTISTACSLKTLGSEYQFQTRFGMKGDDLVVSGVGDPSFVVENLYGIVEALRSLYGIKELKGKIIFDLSFFGMKSLSIADGFEGDEGRSFTSELTPFAFDHNSFGILIAPGNPKALVSIAPSDAVNLKIQNSVQMTSGAIQAVSVDYRPKEKILFLKGSMGRDAGVKAIYRAVPDPYASFVDVFAKIWRDRGGVWLKPAFDFSNSSVSAKNLWLHSSQPLSRILLDINKLSTNFGAEMVSFAAAASQYGTPVNSQKLEKWLQTCVQNYGISLNEMNLKNASGLSRETKVSASALTTFLFKVSQENFFPEYLSSLSVLGKDGTTRSRLKNLAGRGRLKTGSIRGVRSIAGYLYPAGQIPRAFSLIFNNAKISDSEIQVLENKVIEEILDPS